MGFHNPPVSWSELERTLSGRRLADAVDDDSPAFSRHRGPYVPPSIRPPEDVVPYAELHAHSSFSFLDGASGPEDLVVQAERLGLHAIALTDHDGFYGIVRFAEAAQTRRVATVFGAELSLNLPGRRAHEADPAGTHLVVLARGPGGYHRLAAAITHAQLRGGEKGRPVYDVDELAAGADGHWAVLTGCRKGAVRRALAAGDAARAAGELDRLVDVFGHDAVNVELIDHGDPLDGDVNDMLAALARDRGLPVVATNNVHYATPDRRHLAAAIAAVRANRSLDELDGWLPAHAAAHLRSGAEMSRRFARYPGAVARTVRLADELSFPLQSARPALPKLPVPEGHTPMSWLRKLVWDAVPERYPHLTDAGRARIAHELDVIEAKDFPGYFLIVHGIVAKARRLGILCQGRGSAVSSAVCYLLRITAVDAILYDLPFERFLSSMREEEPDIDVDFDAGRREEIIQWVYDTYGRDRAAQVCDVIQYRPRSAVRDMARALGHSPGQQDAWAKQIEHRGDGDGAGDDHDIPDQVIDYAQELLKAPRHLGIHSGGMVLTDRPVGEVVPIERARMAGRTVIQWDKDDAAWMGLVKFDLLGLGMLAVLQHCFDIVRGATGEEWELSTLPKEEAAVYDMLCRADSIGVFQVESRAQMGLLPRLRPREFYDLAIEIALIRPGPIQGGAVHPYVRRKLGSETVSYPHPRLKPVLERTLGIPVFQEQLMQMGMAVGGLGGEDADLLRRAMGSKRGVERIDSLREKLYAGMADNGLVGDAADAIYAQIQAFASFGFAESHSLSFALLVYASSWLKLHYPAAFLAGLLGAQPMGFYSPASLVADARRHGVRVLRPDLHRSGVQAGLELVDAAAAGGVVVPGRAGGAVVPGRAGGVSAPGRAGGVAVPDCAGAAPVGGCPAGGRCGAVPAGERDGAMPTGGRPAGGRGGAAPAGGWGGAVPTGERAGTVSAGGRPAGGRGGAVPAGERGPRARGGASGLTRASMVGEPDYDELREARSSLARAGVAGGASGAACAGVADGASGPPLTGMASCLGEQPPVGPFDPDAPDVSAVHRRDGAFAVRLGLAGVRGIRPELAARIVAERDAHGRYASMGDLVRRVGVSAAQLEALATAGAFECLGLRRREAIWLAGAAATDRAEFLPGSTVAVQPPLFPDPTSRERLVDDLWATGVSCDDHPLTHFRAQLDARGVLTSRELRTHEAGRRVEVAGLVTHRQRPSTASGITFMNLEDEFGLVNIVCPGGVWRRHRRIARNAPVLIVRGMVERSLEGVVNVVADALHDLRVGNIPHRSRDFR